MGSKKVAIIGAGISGLSLGCYLQKSGFSTEIFEANAKPGGLCLGWEREGYLIDGGLEGLWGSGPGHPFYRLYSEIIDMEVLKSIHPKIKSIYDFPDGNRFVEYANLSRLEEEMKAAAPEDETVIREWIGDIRRIAKIDFPVEKPKELYRFSERRRTAKGAALFKKWEKVSAYEFAGRFKNPLLAKAAACFKTPILKEMLELAGMDAAANGYPEGGASGFVSRLVQTYESLGGTLRFMHRAQKIQVVKRKAQGIRFENGEEVRADIIVSAADGRTTLFDLLGGKFINEQIRLFYEKPDLAPSVIQVYIGVGRSFEDDFPARKIVLDAPFELHDGSVHTCVSLMRFSRMVGDKKKTLFRAQMETKFSGYWWLLRKAEPERYKNEKKAIASWVTDLIGSRYFPVEEDIDMINVVTPATYIYLTGNWRGAVRGWGRGNPFGEIPIERELQGLADFYMTGQWIQPEGGIPMAFKSARDLAQIICRREKVDFKPGVR